MNNPVICTERLNLRRMTKDDTKNLMEIFSDPLAIRYYPSTKNEGETLEWIEWTQNNYDQYGVGLLIVEDKVTGEFLGQCGIVQLVCL
jgi:RimJ/RimL family protein N-acetyltransferase